MAEPVDPSVCPLCGDRNDCALADPARATACADCWCARVPFAPELLQRVPAAAANKACICRRCATAGPQPTCKTNSPRV